MKIYLVILLLCAGVQAQEVLKNHDLENTHYAHNWHCQNRCTLSASNDAFSGAHSVHVSNRYDTHFVSGLF